MAFRRRIVGEAAIEKDDQIHEGSMVSVPIRIAPWKETELQTSDGPPGPRVSFPTNVLNIATLRPRSVRGCSHAPILTYRLDLCGSPVLT